MTNTPSLGLILLVTATSLVRILLHRRFKPQSGGSRWFEFSRDLLHALAILAFVVPMNSVLLGLAAGIHVVLWVADIRAAARTQSRTGSEKAPVIPEG